jgi:putative ABC transport system substrate-binding protein
VYRFARAFLAAFPVWALLLGVLLAIPRGAPAQSSEKVYRIGILTSGEHSRIRQSLRELGYIEGRNVIFEARDTQGEPERLGRLASELVQRKVDVILATYPGAVIAAKRATTTIPIVMVNTPDPVELGLVASLARPGGNITGTTSLSVDVSIKQLEILKEAVPGAARIAVLWNPGSPWHPLAVAGLRSQNRLAGVQLQFVGIRSPDEFQGSIAAVVKERTDAVMILADPMLMAPVNRSRLVELLIRNRLPSIGGLRSYAEAGGLLSFWAEEAELYRRVAGYVDKILKGASPDRLPIEQPNLYELVVNLKTAKALGQRIPSSVLLRATVLE